MGILLDGLYVLNIYKVEILILIVSASGLGWWGIRFFQIEDRRSFVPNLSVSLSFGSFILLLVAFTLVILGQFWQPFLKIFSFLVPIFGLIGLVDWFRRSRYIDWQSGLFAFCFLILITLLTRLAFLRWIILPPYDDSPEHYMIVRDLLTSGKSHTAFYSFDSLINRYYHFGFHSLASWLSSVSSVDATQSIPLLGQLFLVILPCSIFFLIYSATQNITAGLMAMLFSAFAWRMPAFATNWGKYPAIAGLAIFPAVIGLWVLFWLKSEKKSLSVLALLVVTAGLGIVHARLVICFFLVLISFFFARKLFFIVDGHSWTNYTLILLTILVFLPFQEQLTTFYGHGYNLALLLAGILLPFTIHLNRQLVLSIALFIFAIWIISFVPISFEGYNTTLLDQPFIETLLCIPLSILGGLGSASLVDRLKLPVLKGFASFAVVVVVFISFVSADAVYPDACCNYVRTSDLEAMQWLRESTPQNSTVWVAAYKPGTYMISIDGGAWVRALTGRNGNKLKYDFDWPSPVSPAKICRPDYIEVYIYKGSSPYSFTDEILAGQDWLAPVFVAGETKIYKAKLPCAE